MAKKKHHEEHHEEHTDESWLVPYADILTLLLALFIVLFAAAQVDQKKFEQIAASLNVAFSGQAMLDSAPGQPSVTQGQPPTPQGMNASGMNEAKEQAFLKESMDLMEAQKKLEQYIKNNNLAGDLQTVMTEDGLMIRIRDSALFPSGSATLLPQSQRFANEIAKMLAVLNQRITVSGHTDNVPINTREFPSNWELSSQRSVNFMRHLIAEGSVKPERFSAIGYGEYRPIMTNETPEGRSKNRRVEVLIMRSTRL
nr:flagellar motor protein MotB [uncultured Anaeromusa sp.]